MGYFSRTVAEAWVTLQVAYRNDIGIRIDYKTAQLEGESSGSAISKFRAAFPDHCDGSFRPVCVVQRSEVPWMPWRMPWKVEDF